MTHQVLCEGSDITLVGWGAQLEVMGQACDAAAKVGGIFNQKIDLACHMSNVFMMMETQVYRI